MSASESVLAPGFHGAGQRGGLSVGSWVTVRNRFSACGLLCGATLKSAISRTGAACDSRGMRAYARKGRVRGGPMVVLVVVRGWAAVSVPGRCG